MTYERKNISAMQGYVSGEQPQAPDVIKLNTNENPYPASPAVTRALAGVGVEQLRRYPPPTALALRRSLAALHGLDADNFLVTNGGDELLRLLLATFVEPTPEHSIAVADPSYSLYDVLAAAHGCGLQRVPLQNDWTLPNDFGARLNATGASLCFVVNPHAPSGTLLPVDTLRQVADEFKGVLVIDEAYVDFIDPALKHSTLPLVATHDNVVILRTFSKGYSLAGLRMAYGIGARSLVDPMQYKTKDSYNTDFIAQVLAQAAIEDGDWFDHTRRAVIDAREHLARELQSLDFSVLPSKTNFVFARHRRQDAGVIARGLREHGILVRHFQAPRIEQYLRITVGTPEQCARLCDTLKTVLSA